MKKRLTSLLAFQGQNPLGIDIYKKYIGFKDRYLYHGHVDDTHLDYIKSSHIVFNADDILKQPINYYNCVINHLALPREQENIPKYIRSLYQIIKPNGLIILSVPNKIPYLNILHWYTKLLPDATSEYEQTIPTQDSICTILGDNAFEIVDIVKPKKELLLKPDVYYNPSGIYDPCWRACDPFWEYVSEKELLRIDKVVSSLFKQMKMYEYIKEVEKEREKYAQVYFKIATKTPYRIFY